MLAAYRLGKVSAETGAAETTAKATAIKSVFIIMFLHLRASEVTPSDIAFGTDQSITRDVTSL
jgi:hypothetical protein